MIYTTDKQLTERKTMKAYKYDEIKSHFEDFINDQDKNWIEKNRRDAFTIHHEVFNTDFYLIGKHQATRWLGDQVFNIINLIKEYEMDNFGSVNTDFSEPESVVNMYTYIIGEEIVNDYLDKLNKAVA